MMSINMPSALPSPSNMQNNREEEPFSWWFEIFDPKSKFVNECNHFLLFVGLFGLYIDPYFFYLPTVDDLGSIEVNLQLGVSVAFFRSIGDFFLFWGMVFRFRTGYEDRGVQIFGKREIVKEPKLVAMKYLKSSFVIDLLASLPLPQVYLGYHILVLKAFRSANLYYNISRIVETQYYVRVIATIVVYMKIEKATGIAIKSPWSGTLYILFVYGMISHFIGAVFYNLYIIELKNCRELVFQMESNATMHVSNQPIAKCSPKNETNQQGLLSDAFANDIGSRSFTQRFMFCFSWGLKTISSMGQNLHSSFLVMETIINLVIILFGLLVFADLIARMQTCMQYAGEREERQMVRQRELEEWANFHVLPRYLKNLVRQTVQFQSHTSGGNNDEALLDLLPVDLRCEIRRHLYLGLVQKLPVFEETNEQFLRAICGHLRTFTGAEGTYIVLEGEPVQQVLFIFSGELEIFSITGGSSGCATVEHSGLCGQELLEWSASLSASTHILPPSTCTVKCLTDVEAFSLLAKDLKLLAVLFDYDQKLFDALLHRP